MFVRIWLFFLWISITLDSLSHTNVGAPTLQWPFVPLPMGEEHKWVRGVKHTQRPVIIVAVPFEYKRYPLLVLIPIRDPRELCVRDYTQHKTTTWLSDQVLAELSLPKPRVEPRCDWPSGSWNTNLIPRELEYQSRQNVRERIKDGFKISSYHFQTHPTITNAWPCF